MACNVFGTPVTVETLKGMPEYADKEQITRRDLAEVALALKNAEGKDIHARTYVENMYKRFDKVHCALGLIYNATGAPLTFYKSWNLYCRVAPAPYPAFIENGQWGAFVCVNMYMHDWDDGCAGAVVYRGRDLDGKEVDYFTGWDTNFFPSRSQACVEIAYPGYFDNCELLKKVKACGQNTVAERSELFSSAMMGNGKMAVLEVIHRLKSSVPVPIH